MNNIKAVIFDLDDTLYPEEAYVKSGFRHVSNIISNKASLQFDYIYNQLILLFLKDKYRVFSRFLDCHNIRDTELEDMLISEYRMHLPDISLNAENHIILQSLIEKGYLLGLITDGRPEGQRNKIEALGLYNYFNHIIVTDELGGIEFRKPNNISFVKMLDYLELKPEETVYVGDNPSKDFVACNNLGMKTIMLINDSGIYSQEIDDIKYRANITIKALYELKSILESW